jgi:hypothetical protein
MPVISSAVFPEYLLTQLQQSADAAARRLKSFIYLHRNSGWYVNGSGNYAVRAHITTGKDQGVNVFFLPSVPAATAPGMFSPPVSFLSGGNYRSSKHIPLCLPTGTAPGTPALSFFICTELNG